MVILLSQAIMARDPQRRVLLLAFEFAPRG